MHCCPYSDVGVEASITAGMLVGVGVADGSADVVDGGAATVTVVSVADGVVGWTGVGTSVDERLADVSTTVGVSLVGSTDTESATGSCVCGCVGPFITTTTAAIATAAAPAPIIAAVVLLIFTVLPKFRRCG